MINPDFKPQRQSQERDVVVFIKSRSSCFARLDMGILDGAREQDDDLGRSSSRGISSPWKKLLEPTAPLKSLSARCHRTS